MIKFFNKIRQKLLTENKFRTYIIYALGEIILVVIGILIALQINNLNDQKNNEAAELGYYCRILDDFELDKKLIDTLETKADQRIESSKKILLDLDAGNKDKQYLLNTFLLALRSDAYVPRNVTFKDLISSGNLKLLQDVALKNSLIQYYSDLENVQSQLKQNRDEKIKMSFELINSSINFGIHELGYVNKILGPEILQILPHEDWTRDKNSEPYQRFQMMLLFNITMADREKQHLATILRVMEAPYQMLLEKCQKRLE